MEKLWGTMVIIMELLWCYRVIMETPLGLEGHNGETMGVLES